jgi:hypothetical protein
MALLWWFSGDLWQVSVQVGWKKKKGNKNIEDEDLD